MPQSESEVNAKCPTILQELFKETTNWREFWQVNGRALIQINHCYFWKTAVSIPPKKSAA